MTNAMIQCECAGWMSPRAIYCPTCGAPVGGHSTPKPNLGWRIVNAFWGAMILAIALLMIFA